MQRAVLIVTLILTTLRRWHPLAGSLAGLAGIEAARLYTYPRALARAHPWWSLDVALVAAWPGVLAYAVTRSRPVLALALAYSAALGASRPWLAEPLYLAGLRAPRIALTLAFGWGLWDLARSADRWPRVAALVLCAGDVAGLLGAWLGPAWARPDWSLTHLPTLAAYAAVGAIAALSRLGRRG